MKSQSNTFFAIINKCFFLIKYVLTIEGYIEMREASLNFIEIKLG